MQNAPHNALKELVDLLQTQPIIVRQRRSEDGRNEGPVLEVIAAQVPVELLRRAEMALADQQEIET